MFDWFYKLVTIKVIFALTYRRRKRSGRSLSMKKGIYFLYKDIDEERPDGIEKKIISQKKMFEKIGYEMDFVTLERKRGTFWHYKKEYSDVDFIYFRKSTVIDFRFCLFYKRIKQNNENVTIFMEIPTYPYEGEFGNSVRSKLALYVDSIFRKKIRGLIDRIVITGVNSIEQLWGIKAINIVNGIDTESVIPAGKRKTDDEIVISCIAKFSMWHGYERLINGINSYYLNGGTRKIKVYMVGDGEEKNKYLDMVNKYHLNDRVIFTGKLTGIELDKIYNLTDLGCCSLGRYKSNVDVIGDLKSREFMAKGLPMICGCKIDILLERFYEFAIFFENNDTDIDINQVIDFYDSLCTRYSLDEIHDKINKTAKLLIDFKKTFSPVICELECIKN